MGGRNDRTMALSVVMSALVLMLPAVVLVLMGMK